MDLVGCAADQGAFGFEAQVQRFQDLDGLCDDLSADTVTREDCDFHIFYYYFSRSQSDLGCRKRKSAPARIVFDDFAGQYLDIGQESGEK